MAARPPRSKCPITPVVLRYLCERVGYIGLDVEEVLCLRTMFSLAFHAFLRVRELCGSRHALQRVDVRLHRSYIIIKFPTYKFSAGRCPSIFIPVRHPSSPFCPVRLLEEYLMRRHGPSKGPLFLDSEGNPYTIQKFRSRLAQVVRVAGLQSWGITPHSFRVGAATSAAALGIPEETIQRMGHWSSRAFF